MKKVVKRVFIVLVCLILSLLLVVGGYVVYLLAQYSRIEDGAVLPVNNPQNGQLAKGQSYSAMTFNIGFGAYNHDFSFFMDTGVMKDGTAVQGSQSRAQSRDVVLANTEGAIAAAAAQTPDFLLLQEVDEDSQRSFGVNQAAAFEAAFPDSASVFASNFHSAYLAYPLLKPHGAVQSGLLTLSTYAIDSAVRRSLPVDDGFPQKFFDLDRCCTVLRLPVEGGHELVLINVHMSAFDEGGKIRALQMDMLHIMLQEERQNGNYVVVGGDFNHALCGTETTFNSQQNVPSWVAVFDEDSLPEGFSVACATNKNEVATCRSTDMPYTKGVNYEAVLDGFIVSDNVSASALNLDEGYENSDHNPVLLQFTLM